jgi:hypothetical protein
MLRVSVPPYYSLAEMIAMIDEPNRTACQRLWDDNRDLFRQAPGSSHNHQAWLGGYQDHITEAMNLWLLLYGTFESTGRLAQLSEHERFSRSDGLLVLIWHDVEKLWTCVLEDGKPVPASNGRLLRKAEFASKAARRQIAETKLYDYGVVLSPLLRNAFNYVEGIRDSDYSPDDRRMLPLAALCHACDMLSARAFYSFPLVGDDAWAPGRAAM